MWLKLLRYGIPLGTLVVVLLLASIARWRSEPVEHDPLAAPAVPGLPPLELAPRTSTLEGLVVTSGEQPVADALVWIAAGGEPAWTFTDESGRFRLGALSAGPWTATIVAIGYVPERLEIADSGRPQTLRIGAPLPPAPVILPFPRSELAGRIVAPLGREDLAGHAVLLSPVVPLETIGAPVPRIAETDSEGRFRFEELIQGEYEVELLPPWARGGSWPDLLRALDAPARRVQHGPEAGELELGLECGEIQGRLLATDGTPLEGALVLVAPRADPARPWPPISSGADGSFVARELPPGTYTVEVRAGAAAAEVDVTLGARERRQAVFEPLSLAPAR